MTLQSSSVEARCFSTSHLLSKCGKPRTLVGRGDGRVHVVVDLRAAGRIHKRDSLNDLGSLPCFKRSAHGEHRIDAGHCSRERIRIPEVARHEIHT